MFQLIRLSQLEAPLSCAQKFARHARDWSNAICSIKLGPGNPEFSI